MLADVVLVSDGGGKARAVLRPIHGAEPIARLLIYVARKYTSESEDLRRATINGLPGFVSFQGDQARRVMAFGIRNGRIHALFVITNPDKLRHLSPPA